MENVEEIALGDGIIVMRNGYPIGYRSTTPVGPKEIRPLERMIEDRLGHPVIFLSLAPEDKYTKSDWVGELFHPNSVLFEKEARQFNNAPPRDPEVIGLWDGKDVADLYAVFRERFENFFGRSLFDMEFLLHSNLVALQSRRLSKEEMKGTGLLAESYNMAYFRDANDRGLVLVPNINWFALCPDKDALVSCVGIALKNRYYSMYNAYGYDRAVENIESAGCSVLIDEVSHEPK